MTKETVKLKVSPHTARLIQSDRDTRLGVANGRLPIEQKELILALFFLSNDPDIEVKKTAQKRLVNLPDDSLEQALSSADTNPGILDFLSRLFPKDLSKIELILKNSATGSHTVERIIENADESTINLLIKNVASIISQPDLAARILTDRFAPAPLIC